MDVATIEPARAMNILGRIVQDLMDLTGDVPPTPALERTSAMEEVQQGHLRTPSRPGTPASSVPMDDIKTLYMDRNIAGSPEAHPSELEGIAAMERLVKEQQDAVARKFFSKKPPPISVNDYLLRLHRYCPMSTAVYLAACVYIHKLAVNDRTVPITPRTVHRLLLACLRIAMKALEDLSYPHRRFAGVGGVSEKELAKLEIAVCYLLDFELRVTKTLLTEKVAALLQLEQTAPQQPPAFKLQMPLKRSSAPPMTVAH